MYQNVSDNENSWDESTKEEAGGGGAGGGETDEGSVCSQRLWNAGAGSLQQVTCTSSNPQELFSRREEHQTPKNNESEDLANSEGLVPDSSDCLDNNDLREIRPNEDFPRNEEEKEHLQFHPQPKLYPMPHHPDLHRLSNQPLDLSDEFETWTPDDDDDYDNSNKKEMVNEINHTTTTTTYDKGKRIAAHYDNETKTTTTTTFNKRLTSPEQSNAEKFRGEDEERTPNKDPGLGPRLVRSSLHRHKETERKRTDPPSCHSLLQQIRKIPSKVFGKIRRKDADEIRTELRKNKELDLDLTLTDRTDNTMTPPDYGNSHRSGLGGGRTEWDSAEDCDFENKTPRDQANALNSIPKLDPRSSRKSGTRGLKDRRSSCCKNDIDRDFQKICSPFSDCSVIKTPDSFPQNSRDPKGKCANYAQRTKPVLSLISRCDDQQQQQRRRLRRLDGSNSSRDSCDAMPFAEYSKSDLRNDFKVTECIPDGKRRVQRDLQSPCIRRRRRRSSSRNRDDTCTASRAMDEERNDPCLGSTMIRTVLTDADGSPVVRMIGEIASQLERRILFYVFSGTDRKSDYGIQVRNIPEAIEETCLDRNTGKVNIVLRSRLIKRCAFVETSVRPFGYRFHFHPQFSIDLLSKYGRIEHSALKSKFFVSPVDVEARQDVIQFIDCACPPSERDHVIVLFNCLLLLSSDDGKSVFIWND